MSREPTIWEADNAPAKFVREDTIWETDEVPRAAGRRSKQSNSSTSASGLSQSRNSDADRSDDSTSESRSAAERRALDTTFNINSEVGNMLASAQLLLEKRGSGYVLQHQIDMSKMSASDHRNSAQHAARMCYLLHGFMAVFNDSQPDLVAQGSALLAEFGAQPPYTPCRFAVMDTFYENHPLAISIKTRPDAGSVARSGRVTRYLALIAKFVEHFQSTADQLRETTNAALIAGVTAGDVFAVRTAVSNGANVNFRTAGGEATPLILCAQHARTGVSIVRGLLSSGADPDLANNHGTTPLMAAAMCSNVEMIRTLLAAGAKPALTDSEGRTALDFALDRAPTEEVLAALVKDGDTTQVTKLTHALVAATKAGNTALMKALISVGADLDFDQLEGHDHLKLLAIAQRSSLLGIRTSRDEIRELRSEISELRKDLESVLHFLKVITRSVDTVAKGQIELSNSSRSLSSSASSSVKSPSNRKTKAK